MENSINAEEKHKSLDFIQQIVEKDLKEGKNGPFADPLPAGA